MQGGRPGSAGARRVLLPAPALSWSLAPAAVQRRGAPVLHPHHAPASRCPRRRPAQRGAAEQLCHPAPGLSPGSRGVQSCPSQPECGPGAEQPQAAWHGQAAVSCRSGSSPAQVPGPTSSCPSPMSLPAPGSSPALHHVHHHPVAGIHRLADQVLEEDEGLHEEVLRGGDIRTPSRGNAALSTGAGSSLATWQRELHLCGPGHGLCRGPAQVAPAPGHRDQGDGPAGTRGGEAGG